MINSLLFLIANLAIFWTMYWAWKQDELPVPNKTANSDVTD